MTNDDTEHFRANRGGTVYGVGHPAGEDSDAGTFDAGGRENEEEESRANEEAAGLVLTRSQYSQGFAAAGGASDDRQLRNNKNVVADHTPVSHAALADMDPDAIATLAERVRGEIDEPAGGIETYRANHSDESHEEECTCADHRAHEEGDLDGEEIASTGYGGYEEWRTNSDRSRRDDGERSNRDRGTDGDEVPAAGYDTWSSNGGD